MALSITTSPALVSGSGTLTTATFSPPAASLLVAFATYYSDPAAPANYARTISGGGLTWTRVARKSSSPTSTGGAAATAYVGADIWVAICPAGASNITVASSATTSASNVLRVQVIVGADLASTGGAVAGAAGSGLPSVTVTTTSADSWIVAVSADYNEQAGGTVGAGQTLIENFDKAGVFMHHLWRTSSQLAVGTAQTMNLTAPASQAYAMAAAEIVALGSSVTAVASSRATSWITAEFTTPLAVSRASGWSARQSVAIICSTSWLTRASIVPTRATTWVARAIVAPVRPASWVTRVTVPGTPRTSSWHTRKAILTSRDVEFSVFTVTTATTVPTLRLRVYAPNGADLGPLPTPESASVSYPLNDVGGLSFNYALVAPRANLLGQPCEIAVELSTDSGKTFVEPPNSRFVYISDSGDPLDRAQKYSVQAKGYVWRLSKARVLPNGLLNADGKRAFLSAKVGVILKTLFNEAQARGAMAGFTHASFSTTLDSAGAAWAATVTLYFDPGLDYLALLTNLAEQGFIDFRMQGRAIYVYNADTALAVDRTVGSTQVTFRAGRDFTEAPYQRTWEGLANYAYFAGDGTAKYEYTEPTAVTPWGRQEVFISNGSVTDAGTMASLTQAELSLGANERISYTRGLDFTRAASAPFTDYGVGDFVWSAVNGSAPTRLRIRQLTLTVNDKAIVSGNVVLNDRFLEADVRQQRRISGITNGASSTSPGTGGTVTGPNAGAPGQVTGLTGSSAAYLGPGGFPQAQVTLTWADVIINADGTPLDDLDHYEISQRVMGSLVSTTRQVNQTTDTSIDMSPYVVGSNWTFSVLAVDQAGNRGAKSVDINVGMAQDTVPPQAPSTPIVTTRLGVLSAYYDGSPATGTWPLDLDHIEVHSSTVNSFTPTAATLSDTLYGEGSSIITGGVYGTPLYVQLVAVDTTGLKSPPSAQGSATPSRLVGSDVDPGAITYEQIAFKDPGNVIADGSFESAAGRASLTAKSDAAWTFGTADFYHGDYCASINAATSPATIRSLVLISSNEAQQILAGDKLFCRFAYKGSVGANGVLQLVAEWEARDGTLTTSTLPGTIKNAAWQQAAAQLTAPANVQNFRLYLQLTAAATTGTYSVDAVEVRRTVGTSIIQDAAIKNAQIDVLAVNSAQIMALDVGKLTAGTMTVDVLLGGRFMTASSGNRVEVSGTGIRMYRGTDVTGHWNPSYGQLRLYSTSDLSHTSTGHAIQFGDDGGQNLAIDSNEIMSRFNGSYGTMFLNREGGSVLLGGIVGGFAADLSDVGDVPQDDNHRVVVQANLEVTNTNEGGYGVDHPPLMIGPRSRPHLWFDANEIGASGSANPVQLYLQPRKDDGSDHAIETIIGSNSLSLRRIGPDSAGIGGWVGPTSGLQFYQDELRVSNAAYSAFAAIRASAFTVTSSQDTKHLVTELDALSVIDAAPSTMWQYHDEIEPGDLWHVGPMIEDLPADLVRESGDGLRGYDVAAAVGVLWAAVRQLSARLDAKDSRDQER